MTEWPLLFNPTIYSKHSLFLWQSTLQSQHPLADGPYSRPLQHLELSILTCFSYSKLLGSPCSEFNLVMQFLALKILCRHAHLKAL